MGATTSTSIPSSCVYPNNNADKKLEPNLTISWLHIPSNENESMHTDILTQQEQVRSFIGNIELKVWNNKAEFDRDVGKIPLTKKTILILNGNAAIYALPRVHHRCQIALVLLYDPLNNREINQEEWNNYNKVRPISLEEIVPRIQTFYARWLRYTNERFSLDIFNNNPKTTLDRSSTDINGSYLFSRLLLDLLFEIKLNPVKERNEFVEECIKQFTDRKAELDQLESFNNDYKPENALNWYTQAIFLHHQLNQALRMQNIDLIFLYRFFLRDIRAQLITNQCQSLVTAYRAQRIFGHELKELKKYIHHKISINSFFSTTLDRSLALFYLGESQTFAITVTGNVFMISIEQNTNQVSVSNRLGPVDEEDPDTVLTGEVLVLFEIVADPSHVIQEKRPFADISPFSAIPEEQEILFMLGTVFRIEEVKEDNDGIWIIKLSLCDDEVEHEIEPILNYLENEYHEATEGDTTGMMTFCSFLSDMGKVDRAEALSKHILQELSPNDAFNKVRCYYLLGNIALHRNQYDIALNLLDKVLKLSPHDHQLIANTNISIGNAHRYQKHFSRAMNSYDTVLTMCKEDTKKDALAIAACYVNIGSLHRMKRNFQKALEYYQNALTICEKYIPVPHPSIGNLHIKLTQIYLDLNQTELTLPHYRKELEICYRCLPRDHPLLSKVYFIVAMAHQHFNDDKGIGEFLDRACVTEFRKSSLQYRWKPFDIKIYCCPRCREMVWIYNAFGMFYRWSCFACMRKILTGRPVNAKMKPVVLSEESLHHSDQRILQNSYAFYQIPDSPLRSSVNSDNGQHK